MVNLLLDDCFTPKEADLRVNDGVKLYARGRSLPTSVRTNAPLRW
jgi:hypothetical protein